MKFCMNLATRDSEIQNLLRNFLIRYSAMNLNDQFLNNYAFFIRERRGEQNYNIISKFFVVDSIDLTKLFENHSKTFGR